MENTATINHPVPVYASSLPPASRILGAAVAFYIDHWQVIAGISAIPFAISLLWILVGQTQSMGFFVLIGLVSFLVAFAARLALFDAIAENGEPQGGILGAYQRGLHYIFSFVWISFLVGFTTLGGTFLLLIPGLLLSIWLSMSLYVLFVEQKGGIDALAVSWHYVKGFWGPVFWRLLFLGFVLAVLSFVVNLVAAGPTILSMVKSGFTSEPEMSIWGQAIGLLYNNFFVIPVGIIYTYIVYRTLRDIKSATPAQDDAPKFKKAIVIFMIIGVVGLLALAVVVGFLLSYAIEYLTNPFLVPKINPAESALRYHFSSGPAALLFSPFTQFMLWR